MILDEIVRGRKRQLALLKRETPFGEIARRAEDYAAARPTLDFAAALRRPGLSVIAEVKRASPSKGLIRADFDPVAIARAYESAGADAVSVLTEETYFQGAARYLTAIRAAVALPLLRKDFIFDPWQVYEARLLGADALLLIAALLPVPALRELRSLAEGLGMQCLVEAHNEAELQAALAAGAKIVGVNNRDLTTFAVDPGTAERLRPLVPEDIVFVAESGVTGPADAKRMAAAGADAVLVGETLMRAPDTGAALRALRSIGIS